MQERDVCGASPTDARAGIRDALAGPDAGDTVRVVTDRNPAVALAQTAIVHGRRLDWEYERDGPDRWKCLVTVGESPETAQSFDVRDLPPSDRHAVLTETFAELAPGQAFVLVNDHDPKPLYHELRSVHGDVVDWTYRDRGDDGWRVEIGKTGESEAETTDVVATFDVREIPKSERHPTIHHRYANVAAGAAIEVVAPHEPRPLHREFEQRYGDGFTWEVLERESGRCRVRITKDETADGDDADESDPATDGTDETLTVTDELDVRDLPPAQRHAEIFQAYERLDGGEAFVLVNDHDPKPLYHQFEAEAGEAFRWTYRQETPGEFRVLIGKAAGVDDADTTGTGAGAAGNTEAPF